MIRTRPWLWGAVLVITGLAATASFGLWSSEADAADHLDFIGTAGTPGNAADIADVYAWHAGGNLVAAITYAGPLAPVAGQTATYDADVLYTLHIDDNDADLEPDHSVHFRFGQDGDDNWGVQVTGFPGAAAAMSNAAGASFDVGDGQVFTGLRDDPFFFDLEGFRATYMTGNLAFDNSRDFFAGGNASSIVIEVPITAVGTGPFNVWATTAQIGG